VRVLALDFDGVVSDSAPEAFLVALRAYLALRPASPLRDALASLEEGGALDRSAVAAHPLYAPFLDAMPLGNRAEDYGVELSALEQGVELRDQRSYDELKAREDPVFLEAFHERFYAERHALTRHDEAAWLRLLGPYPDFVALLRRRAGDAVLALATAKDRQSVELLLEAYGIADLFPADRVLDKDAGVSKRAHLGVLRERLDAEYARMTFVDDKVNHLEDVEGLGVRCALAGWGYNGPREQELARARGYAVCTLESAEEELFGG